MKAKVVRYERVANLGNYESVRIAIELQVDDGEKAQEVLDRARMFVERNIRARLTGEEPGETDERPL